MGIKYLLLVDSSGAPRTQYHLNKEERIKANKDIPLKDHRSGNNNNSQDRIMTDLFKTRQWALLLIPHIMSLLHPQKITHIRHR
jgi:hypothetical protein